MSLIPLLLSLISLAIRFFFLGGLLVVLSTSEPNEYCGGDGAGRNGLLVSLISVTSVTTVGGGVEGFPPEISTL